MNGLFKRIDCYMVYVTNLEEGLRLYRDTLGHELIWRSEDSAGLKMPESDTELVISTAVPQEANLLVANADEAFRLLIEKGCKPLREPFDIAIGRMGLVLDPWGNVLQFLDLSKQRK
jgi:catechol 2,3-dioxygenase-like lactoylglutathione lyase family enzyme